MEAANRQGNGRCFLGRKAERPVRGGGKRAIRQDREAGSQKRFFVGKAEAMNPEKRHSMIKRNHPRLSFCQQCKLEQLSRSAFHNTADAIDADTPAMMKESDSVVTNCPFFGSRQISTYFFASRRHARRAAPREKADGEDGFGGNLQTRRTSRPHPQRLAFPYLLRKMQIDHPNQVWCADIKVVWSRTASCIWRQSWTGQHARS